MSAAKARTEAPIKPTDHTQNCKKTIRIFASFYQSFDLRWFDQYIEQQLTYKVAIMMENVRLLYYEQRITQLTFKETPGVKRHKTS